MKNQFSLLKKVSIALFISLASGLGSLTLDQRELFVYKNSTPMCKLSADEVALTIYGISYENNVSLSALNLAELTKLPLMKQWTYWKILKNKNRKEVLSWLTFLTIISLNKHKITPELAAESISNLKGLKKHSIVKKELNKFIKENKKLLKGLTSLKDSLQSAKETFSTGTNLISQLTK